MSWDIFVQNLPPEARSVEEIPDDFRPAPLGRRADIIAQIRRAAPAADFSDPAWGTIDGPGFSIEVNLGKGETVEGFALHVRGGDGAAAAVASILEALQMRALDSGTGEIFDPRRAEEGLRRWRGYRDRVVGL